MAAIPGADGTIHGCIGARGALRETVLRDFNDERRRTANREVFEKLCQRYEVKVDETALAKAAQIKTAQR